MMSRAARFLRCQKEKTTLTLLLIRMFTNFGRDIVFSADLCYNETNEKPPSESNII